jgi:hypothetical protein
MLNELPSEQKSTKDIDEEVRAKVLKDMLLPNCTKFKQLIVDPILANDLIDVEEPIIEACIIDKFKTLPNPACPNKLIELLSVKKPLHDNDEPKLTKSSADTLSLILTFALRLMLLLNVI